jgi:DNA-binding response OmpR family regulator
LASTGNTADLEARKDRVLFVYPTGPDRDLYVSALSEAGFETSAEATVAAAATLLISGYVTDVIVMELLPEPDEAWAFIEQRCADSSDVPLIIITSLIRPDRANRKRARALGCAAFVAKPCSLMQLVDVVSRVRRGGRGLEISTYAEPAH